MPVTIDDIAPAPAPAAAAAAAPAPAPAPTTPEDPRLASALAVAGGDQALAQKALAQAPKTVPPGSLVEPLEPKDPAKQQIPEAVLRIPAFRALLNGSPPAISSKGAENDPDLVTIQNNVQPLLYAGFGLYRNKANDASYLYNGRFISGDTLKIADDKGKLDEIVPPVSELKQAFAEGLADEGTATPAAEAPASVTPGPQPSGAPAPVGVQKSIGQARVKNIAPGSPSSGPAPGQGRILNSVMKSAV